jgi:hypothetical protein
MPVRGMAETLCACLPTPDAAMSLPCGHTSCSGRTCAVDHSTYRRPSELLAAPEPLARGAGTFRNRPRSSSGCAEAPQALDVASPAAAWRAGGRD